MSHHIFDLPVMVLGALVGLRVDIALVQHFHIAKAWALAGAAPGVLIGGFVAFAMFHVFLDVIGWIDERVRSKKKSP